MTNETLAYKIKRWWSWAKNCRNPWFSKIYTFFHPKTSPTYCLYIPFYDYTHSEEYKNWLMAFLVRRH